MKNQRLQAVLRSLSTFFQSKSIFYFIGRFLLFSLVLFVVWVYVGRYYLMGVAGVSKVVAGLMGYDATLVVDHTIYFVCRGAQIGLTDTELANYNMVPFLALMAATPRMTLRRLGYGLLIGVPIIFLFHIFNLVAHFPYYFAGSTLAESVINAGGIISMGLPFVLWLLLNRSYVSQLFRPQQYRCPFCGEWKTGIMEHIDDMHRPLDNKQQKQLQYFIQSHPPLKGRDK